MAAADAIAAAERRAAEAEAKAREAEAKVAQQKPAARQDETSQPAASAKQNDLGASASPVLTNVLCEQILQRLKTGTANKLQLQSSANSFIRLSALTGRRSHEMPPLRAQKAG
jgi:hypothetical protein